MTIAYARDLPVPQRRALMSATVTVAAPLLWILAATMQARHSESFTAVVPMITTLLFALAIRWGGARAD